MDFESRRDRARYRRLLKLILEGHMAGASTSECCELALALDLPDALPSGYPDRASAWERLNAEQREWVSQFHQEFAVPGNVRAAARDNLERYLAEQRRAEEIVSCPTCDGQGYIDGNECETCEGDPRVPRWLAEEAAAKNSRRHR